MFSRESTSPPYGEIAQKMRTMKKRNFVWDEKQQIHKPADEDTPELLVVNELYRGKSLIWDAALQMHKLVQNKDEPPPCTPEPEVNSNFSYKSTSVILVCYTPIRMCHMYSSLPPPACPL